jgi:hypothetical protein
MVADKRQDFNAKQTIKADSLAGFDQNQTKIKI